MVEGLEGENLAESETLSCLPESHPVAGRIFPMTLPKPQSEEQQQLLQVVWEMFVSTGNWPRFDAVDRYLYNARQLDATRLCAELPAELMYPMNEPLLRADQELQLTIAGIASCEGSQQDVDRFLQVVRVAAELEPAWAAGEGDVTAGPTLALYGIRDRLSPAPPDDGVSLPRLGAILAVERWGTNYVDHSNWTFGLSREVRKFKHVRDLETYWSLRPKLENRVAVTSAGGAMQAEPKVFISHAYGDRALADRLRDVLILGGIPHERIFYSSSRSSGIPSGSDVRVILRTELQNAGLIIELISERFLKRPFCLLELGGAWALEKPTYPIVLPPLQREQVIRQIGNVQMGTLDNDTEIDEVFDELQDRITEALALSLRGAAWNEAVRQFKANMTSTLEALRPSIESAEAAFATLKDRVAKAQTSGIRIDNKTVVDTAYGREVQGEATNLDAKQHTAILKATFYGPNREILGTGDGVVSQLAPDETKTFTIGIPSGLDSFGDYKVQIDSMY